MARKMTILTKRKVKALINENISEARTPKDDAFPLVQMKLPLLSKEDHLSRLGRPNLV